jgi:hypothetical protein
MRGSIFALLRLQMSVANHRLVSERWSPSESLREGTDIVVGSTLSVVVPTNDFSAMFLRYLYRVIRAAIVGNNDLVNACQ